MYYLLGLLGVMAFTICCLVYTLLRYRRALRKLIYNEHHVGANPKSKTMRGLSLLGKRETHPDSAAHQYFLLIEAEALKLESDVLKNIHDFERMI